MKYSIIIPAYNASLYIKKCLNSILNAQNHINFEVVIVDDGSTDNTLQVLKEYESHYSNVIVLSQKNAGPGAARELAMKYASGDYIMFSDSDDFWEADFISDINSTLKIKQPDILEFGYRKVDMKGATINNRPMLAQHYINGHCIEHYVQQNNTANYLCNKVFSAKLFSGVIFPHLFAGEDAAVLLQLFANAKSYISIPNIYYNYVMSPSGLCRIPFSLKKLDIMESDRLMYKYLLNNHPQLCEKFAFAACARSAVLYCELMLSPYKGKTEIRNNVKQQYMAYRCQIHDTVEASKTYSLQRKGIVYLFGINTHLCVLVYGFLKYCKGIKYKGKTYGRANYQ